MPYSPSPFQPGDLVETTESFREHTNAYEKETGCHITTYSKGFIKKIVVCHHKDTNAPICDYIILDNGFGSRSEHFKGVV